MNEETILNRSEFREWIGTYRQTGWLHDIVRVERVGEKKTPPPPPPPPVKAPNAIASVLSSIGPTSSVSQRKNRIRFSPTDPIRTLDEYKIEKLIGSGTYGDVSLAIDKERKEKVALKRMKLEKETDGFPLTAIREIKILSKVNHENVVFLNEVVSSLTSLDNPKDLGYVLFFFLTGFCCCCIAKN